MAGWVIRVWLFLVVTVIKLGFLKLIIIIVGGTGMVMNHVVELKLDKCV